MPIYDFITELLELEDIILKDFSFTNTEIHISFSLKRKPTVCPCCGFITEQVHDYRPFTIEDLPMMGKHLLKNRYSVRNTATFLGISDSTIFRKLKNIRYPMPDKLPAVLSIDEFRGNSGGQKFHVILTDTYNHELFDILPTRSQTNLMLYLNTFKKEGGPLSRYRYEQGVQRSGRSILSECYDCN